MLDLNNLKQINDVKGHATGDELIISLAGCLIETFAHIGKIYRIGGDEFIILLKDLPEPDIDRYLENLKNTIDSQGNTELSSNTVAFGYAQRTKKMNTDKGIYDLFKMADEKMYDDKNRKKSLVPETVSE